MARLIATTPCGDLLPAAGGGAILTEAAAVDCYSVAPYKGMEKACSTALKKACGIALPEPNRTASNDGVRVIWSGQGRYLVMAADAPDIFAGIASVTDQSDANATIVLDGATARAILARLTPIDLRDSAMPVGATARSLIGHMSASITRIAADEYELMVMRSMAATLVHEVTESMRGLGARAAATGLGG